MSIFESMDLNTGWKYFGNVLDAGRCSICGEESFVRRTPTYPDASTSHAHSAIFCCSTANELTDSAGLCL